MKKLSLSKNRIRRIAVTGLLLMFCQFNFACQEKPKSTKTSTITPAKKSDVKKSQPSTSTTSSNPVPKSKKDTVKKKNDGKEINHQSEDQKKLDSLKAAKDKAKGIK